MPNEKKDFMEWLTAIAIIVVGFVGIVTSANALNHSESGFVTTCAIVNLLIILGECGYAFKKRVIDNWKNNS